MTLKIKIGTLLLTEARDETLPQEFAAWHQTVRVEPGTYDVFAYLDWLASGYSIHSISAQCEGITISSNFRAHMFGQWGKSDNNRNGQHATAHIHLPTYGRVDEPSPLLAQAALCDAITRAVWASERGPMWRFVWNQDRKPFVIERARHSGGLSLAAFEDCRSFRMDDVVLTPTDLAKFDLSFQHVGVDQLTVGETVAGWSWNDKRSIQVTRLA